jgi:hypothetical protein
MLFLTICFIIGITLYSRHQIQEDIFYERLQEILELTEKTNESLQKCIDAFGGKDVQ